MCVLIFVEALGGITYFVQSVPRQSPDIYRHAELFSKTVFGIASSTFRMYFVMAILKSSIMWGLYEYAESGAQGFCDHPV